MFQANRRAAADADSQAKEKRVVESGVASWAHRSCRPRFAGQGVLKRNQLAVGMKSRQPQGVKSCDSAQGTGMAVACASCDA